MPKKLHPADQADIAAIGTANQFVVHMRRGPADVFKREAGSLTEAATIAAEVRAENPGRDCLVYAITADGASIPVPKAMQRAAIAVPGGASKPGRPVKPAKPALPPEKPASGRALGRRAATLEAAQRGELPAAPDFSAETHKRFRPKLAEVVKLAEAGDIAGLQAFQINPVSSSPKAIAKYRDLAVIALRVARGA